MQPKSNVLFEFPLFLTLVLEDENNGSPQMIEHREGRYRGIAIYTDEILAERACMAWHQDAEIFLIESLEDLRTTCRNLRDHLKTTHLVFDPDRQEEASARWAPFTNFGV